MSIQVLDQETINKIAAGEVIERPSSVVKELVENAIDAKATAITIEIKDGGISMIRITDNGSGIDGDEIAKAFLRHSTSKIRSVEDLLNVSSLGFRGEALSSIAAVSQIELITKTTESFTGYRYVIEGGKEISLEEVGAPDGTTFIVRNLFYNTPVRRKFLKTAQTEAGYVSSLIEHLALSHPDVSFRFINNNQNRLHTSGNMNLKDIIYSVYGRDITKNLIAMNAATQDIEISGFIGKPLICRGNRGYENYYINGRYIKSGIITRAIEEAYKGYIMPHNYPFTAMHFKINPAILDVNVHPTKMELRFSKNDYVYNFVLDSVRSALKSGDLAPEVSVGAKAAETKTAPASIKESAEVSVSAKATEAAEKLKTQTLQAAQSVHSQEAHSLNNEAQRQPVQEAQPQPQSAQPQSAPKQSASKQSEPKQSEQKQSEPKQFALEQSSPKQSEPKRFALEQEQTDRQAQPQFTQKTERLPEPYEIKRSNEMAVRDNERLYQIKKSEENKQLSIFNTPLMNVDNRRKYRIIGQLFDTYWLIEFEDKFYIMDQHAAHEKILFEKTMKCLHERNMDSQMIMPPVVLELTMAQEEVLKANIEAFTRIGFEIEEFGGNAYKVTGIPASLPNVDLKQLLIDMLDGLTEEYKKDLDIITEKVASMSCKAAVKGNNKMSFAEAQELIEKLMEAENPYNCPHGRPTLIMMSKYEIEKKFKRIL